MRRALPGLLPWLVLLGLWLYVCAPLLQNDGARIFIGGLSGDGISTIWFYDLLGRTLPAAPGELADFDWPWPHATRVEFPSVTDAAIGGAVLRVAGWRAGWGWVQALALGINALGAAALARGAGARGTGVVLAGGLALLCRQTWFNLISARMNVVWPGFAMLAIAAVLLLLRREGLSRPARLALVGVGAVAGANAALIYPPQLAALIPAGLLLVAGPLWRARWRERLWAALPAVLALAWVWPELTAIAGARDGYQHCSHMDCPDRVHALTLEQLALDHMQWDGLSRPGFFWTTWIAAPLALLHRRRATLLLVGAMIPPLLWVALGPCAEVWPGRTLESLHGMWCILSKLSDYGRTATIAALLAAVLGGLGVGALPGAPVRWAAAGAVLWLTWQQLLPEYMAHDKWRTPTLPLSARFLHSAEPGPVAELPYDRAAQYLSVLEAPGRPRVNPLKPAPRVEYVTPTWAWLHAIGRGEPDPGHAVSRADVEALRLRWILYEPERCGRVSVTCGEDGVARLTAVLGPPRVEEGGRLLVWPLP